MGENEPGDRTGVIAERRFGLEGDVAGDRGVVAGVDLALAEPLAHVFSMARAALTTWAVVNG